MNLSVSNRVHGSDYMMTKHLFRIFPAILSLILGALLLGCAQKDNELPDGLEQLATAFTSANQAPNTDQMLGLYYLEGADQRTRDLLKAALDYEIGLPIQAINFEPLQGAPEETIDFVHQGTAYGPSIPPKYRMRVAYAVEDGFTSLFTIGQTPTGDWRIVCAKPKPEPEF